MTQQATPPDDARSDAELLAAHVEGDHQAFAELVHRHERQLRRLAYLTSRHHDDAEDAFQDALLSAHRTAASFRYDSAVSSWLYRIVVNACLDRLRRRRPTSELPEDHAAILADRRDHHSSAETGIDVRAALATLPEGQRLALTLVDMHGLSVAETAQVLGVAEGTVKSRCARGRAALAPLLRP